MKLFKKCGNEITEHNVQSRKKKTMRSGVDSCVKINEDGVASLQEVMGQGRREIKDAQEKLNSSLNTPIVEGEAKVLERPEWFSETKDIHRRYNALPPINGGKKVKSKSMAFTVD